MIIYTPRLCSEPVFLEGRDASTEPSQQIECQPVVSKLRATVDPAQQSQHEPESLRPGTEATTIGLDGELDRLRKRQGDRQPLDYDSTTPESDSSPTSGVGDDASPVRDEAADFDVLTVVYDPETGEVSTPGSDVTREELAEVLAGRGRTREARPLEGRRDANRGQDVDQDGAADAGPSIESFEALTKLVSTCPPFSEMRSL